ncbi:12802_t:CDS:2 [Cetraspora pellucida]|uniref:12802_t:CDS:1 n=1 Tax=Cetraspora pellucida TaxID=1433469 RepID=A0ACA9NJT6_9GLOM|nr:12802_t:CDS:2 [Cetraspora pellucida]
MLKEYEPCCSYLETKLYPCHESWARYAILKLFTAGAESTQRVESINGVLKKHLDRDTLLKELVKIIEQELEKEASYNRIRDYYRSNPSSGLLSTYNTIFKTIDLIQESSIETDSIIEHLYDVPQIRLRELLLDILDDDILEIWEVFYIGINLTAKSYYVVILKDSTVLCTCIQIINFGMSCRHQYRIFIQSSIAVFHLGLIHMRWFKSIPFEAN